MSETRGRLIITAFEQEIKTNRAINFTPHYEDHQFVYWVSLCVYT